MVIYLLEKDAELLSEIARRLRFKSRSELIVAILERLILGGFALIAWIKTGLQFQKRFDRHPENAGTRFYWGMNPLPPLPEENRPSPPVSDEDLSTEDFTGVIDEMREEMARADSEKRTPSP